MSNTKKYRVFRGDLDIFIQDSKLDEYLNKYKISLNILPNGVLIVGGNRFYEDSVYSEVGLTFPSSSFYEPSDKRGITHLIEHLISNKPGFLSRYNEANYNASTYSNRVDFNVNGISNLSSTDYGVWPVIPVLMNNLTNTAIFTDDQIENEKKVVISEIHEQHANPAYVLSELYRKIIYDKSNPYYHDVIGEAETIKSISLEDVKKWHERILIPKGLEVVVYTEADSDLKDVLLKGITELLNPMSSSVEPLTLTDSMYRRVNPGFKQGEVYLKESNLNNNLVQINYVWIVDANGYTTHTYAITRFFEVAEQKMFRLFREKGIGYSAQKFDTDLGDTKRIIGFELNIPKVGAIEVYARELYEMLKKEIFEDFSDEDIKYITDITLKRSDSTPITVGNRLGDILQGLRYYGKVIDTNKATDIHSLITPDHLRKAQETFLSTYPSILILGDLG